MSTSPFLHKARDFSRHSLDYLKSLFRNKYFWIGFGGLVGVGLFVFVFFNNLVMPLYTRHDVAVEVPAVVEMPFEEAAALLEANDLEVERVMQRYSPDYPRDVIVDQVPAAHERVKPGRRVYVTVNAGEIPMVTVPSVEGMSLREAKNQLMAHRLEVAQERPDSIPSPYRNTVTRQRPQPGDSLPVGSSVTLWYSTGLGDRYVQVPDVVGLFVEEAKTVLLERRLRAVIVGRETDEAGEITSELLVVRQSREPGTRVREGFEVRLFVGTEEDLQAQEEESQEEVQAETREEPEAEETLDQ